MIDLTQAEEVRLHTAEQQNRVNSTELAYKLVGEQLPIEKREAQEPTLALFAQWNQEDASMTPEQVEAERFLWDQFETDINHVRCASGMRTL